MEPLELVPTWRNYISGKDGISKKLDRFFVAKEILEEVDRLKSWVGEGGASNHLPILLQMEKEEHKSLRP
jgi:hypothetical protein